MYITYTKGGIFSYLGQAAITADKVLITDYTDWDIAVRLEDKYGNDLPILVAEWTNNVTGTFRIRGDIEDMGELVEGHPYAGWIEFTNPTGDTLEPFRFTLATRNS